MNTRIPLAVGTFVPLLFITCVTSAAPKTLTVSPDGSAQFKTVQAAIDAAPEHSADPIVIHIKPGTYKERVRVPRDKVRLALRGDDAKTTILTYDLHAKSMLPAATQPVGTSGSYSTLIDGDDFTAENLTFENTAGEVGQAVALRTTGRRQTYRNCRMLGWQDTLYVHTGSAYFVDCYVEGRVDFIFGRATAVFERCHVHSKNGGYVTAAATEKDQPFGFVFLDCKLTGDGAPAYLGRPWRDDAAVAFIRCELGSHIRPEGWHNWDKPEREKTARYVEHKNTGPGADRSKRVSWSRELNDEEVAQYTVKNIFAAEQGWDPAAARVPAGTSAGTKNVRIVLAGDSTVTDGAGWGRGFADRFGPGIEVTNLSQGGRSSKSYRDEGWWKKVLDAKPDYVLIQFGHNDQPGKGPERETDPKTAFRENLKRYAAESRSAGAAPVLVTSMERRAFDGAKIRPTLAEYADATRHVAAEENVPLIDLHTRSIEVYERLGPEKWAELSPRKKDGTIDGSHLNAESGRLIGSIVADELSKAVPELATHVAQKQ